MGIKHVFGQTNILHPRSGSSQDEREQDEAEKSLASIPVTTVTSTGVQQADQCLAGLAERTNILVWDYAPNPGEDLEEGYTIRVIPRSASVEREDLRPESPHGSIHDHSARFEPVTNRDKAYSESFKKHPEWIAWQEQNLDGTSTRPPNGPPIPGTKRKRSDPEPGRNESPPRKVAKARSPQQTLRGSPGSRRPSILAGLAQQWDLRMSPRSESAVPQSL
ncbi:MAG: hypothetical protein M1832_000500 [Thelocarpon impressellum]|nr:MAG: hypothetical protein M1832_000500 [Thelocarpon impressellum]